MAVYLTGESGSFTFSGAESLIVADFGEWNATIDRKVYPSTPFGYITDRVTLGRQTVSGSFTGFFDGTKPPIPANGATSGTLTLYLKTTSTTVTYTFKARIFALSTGANSVSGEPIRQTYQFVGSADSASDTIT